MHEIPQLDSKGLRKFGLTTGGIVVVLFGLLLPWLRDRPLPWWPWGMAAILGLWALVAPGSLNLVYRPWMKVGLILGWINTRIILGIVFWIIILPLGILLRLVKEKKVSRMIGGFEASSATYWNLCSNHKTNMEKPF
jgi:hypothetical protein